MDDVSSIINVLELPARVVQVFNVTLNALRVLAFQVESKCEVLMSLIDLAQLLVDLHRRTKLPSLIESEWALLLASCSAASPAIRWQLRTSPVSQAYWPSGIDSDHSSDQVPKFNGNYTSDFSKSLSALGKSLFAAEVIPIKEYSTGLRWLIWIALLKCCIA